MPRSVDEAVPAAADATVDVMPRRLQLLLLSVVAVIVVAAAGCGGTSVAIPELTSFDTVAAKSSSADSARFALELKLALPGSSKELAFTADGAFDNAARRSEMRVDMSAIADLFAMLGSTFGGKVTGDVGNPEEWKLHVIQDGDTAYVQFPPLEKQLPAGKTWVEGDAKDLQQADSGQLGQLGSFAGTDPKDAFAMLKAVSGTIEAVGTDEIRGVETSHYRATIDPAKVEGLLPRDQQQSLNGLSMLGTDVKTVPVDVWVDGDDQIRKLAIDLEQTEPGTDKTAKASLVLEVYDYGTPLELELPPAEKVVAASTLKTS